MSWVNERGTSLMSIIINTRPDIKGEDRLRIADDLEEEYGIDIIPLIEEINELTENIRWIDARQDDPNYETILSLWEAQYGNGRTLEQNKEYLRSLQEQYNNLLKLKVFLQVLLLLIINQFYLLLRLE